ncbi:hypothetical protein [Halomonas sp. KAO]|nr:hypothetical protein [Halomonas sp. KAO]
MARHPASAILLGERLEWRHLAGMELIGLGLVSIDGRPWRWIRSVA